MNRAIINETKRLRSEINKIKRRRLALARLRMIAEAHFAQVRPVAIDVIPPPQTGTGRSQRKKCHCAKH